MIRPSPEGTGTRELQRSSMGRKLYEAHPQAGAFTGELEH